MKLLNKSKSVAAVLLFSSADTNVANSMIIPMMGLLTTMFPNSGTQVNMLISLPSLLMIPAIFITGKLANYYSKKTLLNLGLVLYIIGGLGGCLVENISYIVVMRGILGIGCGMIYPLVPAFIAQLYEGQERAKMMGWASATGSILAMAMAMASGFLATLNWKYPFFLDLLYIILLVAQVRVLPKVPPEKLEISTSQGKEKVGLGRSVYLSIFAIFVYLMISMVYIFKIAIFIQTENLGNSAQAGLASSATTFSAFVISLFFVYILKGLKRYTSVLSLVSLALCFSLLSIAQSFQMVLYASVFMGCSLGLMFPYMNIRISTIAPLGTRTYALSLMGSAIYTGQFLASYYVQLIETLFKGTLRNTFAVMVGNLLICIIVAIICILFTESRLARSNSGNDSLSR